MQAYFDYQNGLGGVNGRELVISRTDDDEVGNTQVKALELIGDDSIFGIFGAPLQYAGFADIGAAGVPLYTTFPASRRGERLRQHLRPHRNAVRRLCDTRRR